jgi:uncharacterized protein
MVGELDKNQIEDFLKSELIGRIGCYGDGKVYVVPVTYAYENGYIYGHTKDGLKIRMMRNNPNVCFEIDWMKNMKNWKSVIVYGTIEELKGDNAKNGLEILFKRIMSIVSETPSQIEPPNHNNIDVEDFAFQQSFLSPFLHSPDNENFEIISYRIKVNEFTGKFDKG